jgi:hypothetical protein
MGRVEVRAEIEQPLTVYDLNNPPWLPPGEFPEIRRAWASAVAQYLKALRAGVGLDPVGQQINSEVDARGLVTRVRLTHPLLEIAAYLRGGGTSVGIFYQSGPQSPLWATRHPDEVQYYGVFRDATAPPARRLIRRMRWLAGFEAAAVSRNARSREV